MYGTLVGCVPFKEGEFIFRDYSTLLVLTHLTRVEQFVNQRGIGCKVVSRWIYVHVRSFWSKIGFQTAESLTCSVVVRY